MEKDKRILSEITVYNKYARYLPKENRRESWDELVDRNMEMHKKKYPTIQGEIESVYNEFVRTKKVLPSMRSLQFGGRAIEVTNARIYNCSFLPIDSIAAFSETMFLLLNGCGVGYSVQKFNVNKLPVIKKPNKDRKRKFLVQDDIIGWAEAVKALMKSYTGRTTSSLQFDFSAIREKGAMLITSGGKAPGPDPLRIALVKIESILSNKKDGEKLTSLECHDICCHLADAVLSGGVRRAAMICLFDKEDTSMITCKTGNWWELNPQRGRSNNSVVLKRSTTTKEDFESIWEKVKLSGAGEPGFYFTEDENLGTNPCCLTGDMKLKTSEGYKCMEDLSPDGEKQLHKLINNEGDEVNGLVWKTGVKDVFTLKCGSTKDPYIIRGTREHRFMTTEGEFELGELQGKKLVLGYTMSPLYDSDEVRYGFLLGDGHFRKDEGRHKNIECSFTPIKDDEVSSMFQKTGDSKSDTAFTVDVSFKELISFGIDVNKLVTERVYPDNLTLSQTKMFLQGLYSANGSVIKTGRVSYKTTSKALANSIVKELSRVGIEDSYITTNKPSKVTWSNGDYVSKESYDVNISTTKGVVKFAEEISFVQTYKRESLEKIILDKSPYVFSIKPSGKESVYDFSMLDGPNWGIVEGVVTHNCEIALKPHGFCNLTEINASTVTTQEELNDRARAAAFIGTLQAGYTDFHYLRDEWRKNAEEEALLGVSMTGLANTNLLSLDLSVSAEVVVEENKRVAKLIGINPAKRTTCVKPAGTTSLVLGTSSGVHAWHNDYYIRRMRLNKNESLYSYLAIHHPDLVEDEVFSPETTAVVSVPQKAPDGAVTRHEDVFSLLERVKKVSVDWIKPGHVEGDNTHNVSCTISLKDEDWQPVGEWMWENRYFYNGISVLPYHGGTYAQTPFEDCTEGTYNKMVKSLNDIDLSKVIELEDTTNLKDQAACGGGSCEII
jgi:hypothetical protein